MKFEFAHFTKDGVRGEKMTGSSGPGDTELYFSLEISKTQTHAFSSGIENPTFSGDTKKTWRNMVCITEAVMTQSNPNYLVEN